MIKFFDSQVNQLVLGLYFDLQVYLDSMSGDGSMLRIKLLSSAVFSGAEMGELTSEICVLYFNLAPLLLIYFEDVVVVIDYG